jgi:hypothetical protein
MSLKQLVQDAVMHYFLERTLTGFVRRRKPVAAVLLHPDGGVIFANGRPQDVSSWQRYRPSPSHTLILPPEPARPHELWLHTFPSGALLILAFARRAGSARAKAVTSLLTTLRPYLAFEHAHDPQPPLSAMAPRPVPPHSLDVRATSTRRRSA